jgi:DNA-binding transcriptional LysR family regulator
MQKAWMMVNFNQLRIFYYTAKHQNCTVAAQNLSITQPAVTAQLKAFEDACNLKLFKKKGRNIYLTDEGRTLYRYVSKVFEFEKELENAIEDMRELKRGLLRLGTTKTYAQSYMPFLVARFRRSHPHIKIYLDEGSSLQMAKSLLDFQNEIVIVAKVEENDQIDFVPLCREEIVALFPPEHYLSQRKSITMAELAKEPIVMKEAGSGTRKAVSDSFLKRGLTPNILMETNNTDFIKQLVRRGDGISFLVRSAVSPELAEGNLVSIPIEDGHIFSDVNIAYLKNQHLSTPAQAFLHILDDLSSEEAPVQSIGTLFAKMAAQPL